MIGLILTLIISPICLGNVKVCDRCKSPYQIVSRLERNHLSNVVKISAKRAKMQFTPSSNSAMLKLMWKESTWNPRMQSRSSTSSTLNGFLNSTWKNVGIKKSSCHYCQVEAMWLYIKYRYKTPERALKFHNSRRPSWY